MIPGAADERRARSRGIIPLRWALAPLVIVLHVGLGYLIVSALTTSGGPRIPEAANVASSVPTSSKSFSGPTKATKSAARFSKLTGLEVLWVAVSGAGGIVDLRYRVVDEKTAASHASHQVVPAIIDSQTGKTLTKQWMGHAHPPDNFNQDRNYWMLFLNPKELVKPGDKVAVRLGHARLTGVRVH